LQAYAQERVLAALDAVHRGVDLSHHAAAQHGVDDLASRQLLCDLAREVRLATVVRVLQHGPHAL
jgi:stage III sporulation protein SpoIIIAA